MVDCVEGFNEVNKEDVGFFAVVPSRSEYVADCMKRFLASDMSELCWGSYFFYLL